MSESMLDKRSSRDVQVKSIDIEHERKALGDRAIRTLRDNERIDNASQSRNKYYRKRYRDFVNGKTEGVLNVVIKDAK